MSVPGRTLQFVSTHRTGILRRKAWTTAAVAFSLVCSLMTAGLAGSSGTPGWNLGLGVALNLIAGVALIWRHERPWVVLGLALAGPLFFATDATAALIALFAVGAFARTKPLVMGAVADCASSTSDAFPDQADRQVHPSTASEDSHRPKTLDRM